MPPAMKTKTAAADTIGFMSKRDEDLITDISVLSDLGGSPEVLQATMIFGRCNLQE